MTLPKIRSILIFIITVCIILGVSAAVIAYGRGYRVNVNKNSLTPTGLISATSDPVGAQVLVDNQLKTATNNSFAIEPGWYTVRIIKEAFIPWEKKIRVQGEVVTRADAFLFPTNPSLSPLTRTGMEQPTLSPDGSKIAYTIPLSIPQDGQVINAGLWVYTPPLYTQRPFLMMQVYSRPHPLVVCCGGNETTGVMLLTSFATCLRLLLLLPTTLSIHWGFLREYGREPLPGFGKRQSGGCNYDCYQS